MRIVKQKVYRDKAGKFIPVKKALKMKKKAQIVKIPVYSR